MLLDGDGGTTEAAGKATIDTLGDVTVSTQVTYKPAGEDKVTVLLDGSGTVNVGPNGGTLTTEGGIVITLGGAEVGSGSVGVSTTSEGQITITTTATISDGGVEGTTTATTTISPNGTVSHGVEGVVSVAVTNPDRDPIIITATGGVGSESGPHIGIGVSFNPSGGPITLGAGGDVEFTPAGPVTTGEVSMALELAENVTAETVYGVDGDGKETAVVRIIFEF